MKENRYLTALAARVYAELRGKILIRRAEQSLKAAHQAGFSPTDTQRNLIDTMDPLSKDLRTVSSDDPSSLSGFVNSNIPPDHPTTSGRIAVRRQENIIEATQNIREIVRNIERKKRPPFLKRVLKR